MTRKPKRSTPKKRRNVTAPTPAGDNYSIAEIFDRASFAPSVTIPDTGGKRRVLDEDEESKLYGPGTEGFDRPDLTPQKWQDGAAVFIDADVEDRRAHTHYSREEVSEYIDQLAEGLDLDISQLYDWYYGYTDDAA